MRDQSVTFRPQAEIVQEINLLLPTPSPGQTVLDPPTNQAFQLEMDDAKDIVNRIYELRQDRENWNPDELRREIGDALGQSRSAFWKGIGPDELMSKIVVL